MLGHVLFMSSGSSPKALHGAQVARDSGRPRRVRGMNSGRKPREQCTHHGVPRAPADRSRWRSLATDSDGDPLPQIRMGIPCHRSGWRSLATATDGDPLPKVRLKIPCHRSGWRSLVTDPDGDPLPQIRMEIPCHRSGWRSHATDPGEDPLPPPHAPDSAQQSPEDRLINASLTEAVPSPEYSRCTVAPLILICSRRNDQA